jgi:2-dehydro-3-deoxygalactonokinase
VTFALHRTDISDFQYSSIFDQSSRGTSVLTTPALIALDWGTSNLRASLLDGNGHVSKNRSAPGGVMAVKNGQFSAALLALCGDWITQFDCPLIASGMIGSRQGWKEAPYLDCPATIAQAATQLTQVAIDSQNSDRPARLLHIAAGLKCVDSGGEFDVMRGEEIQIWGADLPPQSCCVLPGTHSKWAWLGNSGLGGEVSHFRTFMTGELYGLLTQHGILGRLMDFEGAGSTFHNDEFSAGVQLGLRGHSQMSHTIFAARTAGLMGRVAPSGLPDYLSGILIGIEIGSATLDGRPQSGVTLIGDDGLCVRYEAALEVAGIGSRRAPEGTTTRGQWMIAVAAGLVAPAA